MLLVNLLCPHLEVQLPSKLTSQNEAVFPIRTIAPSSDIFPLLDPKISGGNSHYKLQEFINLPQYSFQDFQGRQLLPIHWADHR